VVFRRSTPAPDCWLLVAASALCSPPAAVSAGPSAASSAAPQPRTRSSGPGTLPSARTRGERLLLVLPKQSTPSESESGRITGQRIRSSPLYRAQGAWRMAHRRKPEALKTKDSWDVTGCHRFALGATGGPEAGFSTPMSQVCTNDSYSYNKGLSPFAKKTGWSAPRPRPPGAPLVLGSFVFVSGARKGCLALARAVASPGGPCTASQLEFLGGHI
jgi:hypothetical protein